MAIQFTCPHCGLVTDVADQYAGQKGPCADCGKTITIPGSRDGPPHSWRWMRRRSAGWAREPRSSLSRQSPWFWW